jgi:hypothetical protein
MIRTAPTTFSELEVSMINFKRVGRLFSAALVLVASFATASGAQAQAVISGRVTDAAGNGIPGANVVIPSLGLGVGANTRADGTYTITLPTNSVGRSVVVTARRIGFAPVSRDVTVTAGTQTQNFQLTQDATRIDDVVVTGVAEATSAKNLTISVGKVGEAQLKDVPAVSPATALAGKVAGVRVSFTQGQPGSSPAIRVRTSTNLGVGGQEPLVIIDGVVSQNDLRIGGRQRRREQPDQAWNRFAGRQGELPHPQRVRCQLGRELRSASHEAPVQAELGRTVHPQRKRQPHP